jgi:hypothetical protein
MSNSAVRGEFEDLEGFLADRERDRGGFEGILKWKKKEPPVLDAWLSMRRKPIKICRHNFPQIVSFEKEGEQKSHVFTWRGGCYEPHAVIENQNWRNKETGIRVEKYEEGKKIAGAPQTCPQCLFIEWLRAKVIEGELGQGFADFTWKEKGGERTEKANYSLVEPVFRLQGESDDEETIVTAGGFCNLFKEKNLDDADKKLLAKSGILLTEAWKQNGLTGTNYLFTVADNDDLGSGVHKAVEAEQLGKGVIKVIADLMKGVPKNPDKYNLFKNPYCFRWTHIPKGTRENPFLRYEVIRIDPEEVPFTDGVKEVLQQDPPDVTEETSYLDSDALRTMMEAACVLKDVPWDEFFKHPSPDGVARADSAKAPSPKPREEKAPPPKQESKAAEKDPKNPLGLDPEGDDTCGCECPVKEGSEEQCGGLMRISDDTCPVCKAVYDLAADPVALVKRPWDKPKEEAPKPRGRAAAKVAEPEKGKGGAIPGKDKLAW